MTILSRRTTKTRGDAVMRRALFFPTSPDAALGAGFGVLGAWGLALGIPETPIFYFLRQAGENLDGGALLLAGSALVLLNTLRAFFLYTGWFLVGDAIAERSSRLRRLSWILPLVAIPGSYALLARFSGSLVLHFGTPALLSVLSVGILHAITRDIPVWGARALAQGILLFSFQWLDIVPFLTPYGFGRGELSMAVKGLSTVLGGEAHRMLGGAGTLVFLGTFAGGLATAELLVGFSKRLRQLLRLREQERQIATLREEALGARSLREMGQLVHDLKRPLTAVTGLTDVLLTTPRPAEERAYLERIAAAAAAMNTMISEILSGEIRRSVSAQDVVSYTLAQISALPWHDRIHTVADADASACPVRANLVRLSRALVNLLDNAHRASAGLELSRIILRVSCQGNAVRFDVEDRGPGFSDALPAGTSGWRSTGLGLAFVREVAQAHGGTVLQENLPGGGARMGLLLPRYETEGDAP